MRLRAMGMDREDTHELGRWEERKGELRAELVDKRKLTHDFFPGLRVDGLGVAIRPLAIGLKVSASSASLGRSLTDRAGGETFLVSKTIQVTMNGLAIALRNAREVVGFDASEPESRIQPKTRPRSKKQATKRFRR